jgi:hypothetical protein
MCWRQGRVGHEMYGITQIRRLVPPGLCSQVVKLLFPCYPQPWNTWQTTISRVDDAKWSVISELKSVFLYRYKTSVKILELLKFVIVLFTDSNPSHKIVPLLMFLWSQDSSFGTVTRQRAGNWGISFRLLVETKDTFLFYSGQTGPGADPAPCSLGSSASFSQSKATGAWS